MFYKIKGREDLFPERESLNKQSTLSFKLKFAYIFRNWKFDRCRADLTEKKIPGKLPGTFYACEDLSHDTTLKDESCVAELFKEYFGVNAVNYVNLTESQDPFDLIETTLKTIMTNILTPSYDRKEHIFLVFYFTGHGYADEQQRSQILLNIPIAQHSLGKKFQNPYRIEEKL
jgi:hypothetical protein